MITTETIRNRLSEFAASSPLNRVPELGIPTIFESPVVAVADAADPLFLKLKEPGVVAPDHMTPREWLPEAKSVICWFLPFSETIRKSNRTFIDLPSKEWTYGRYEGENFNRAMRAYLKEVLEKNGNRCVSPALDPRFKVTIANYTSTWSERHAAFVAGLGTFNLSRSMITEKGCAGRFGSIITELELEPTIRPYSGHTDYCNNCGACIPRCPVDAIDADGKSQPPCHAHMDAMLEKYSPRYGCGKCQTGVPCEHGIPATVQSAG